MILELNDVQAYYDKSHILNGVTLAVEEGTCTCVLGRNGVGKSTTMKTIMGMLNPKEHCRTEGSIKFNDRELVGLESHQIAGLGIAYVPQGRHIFPTLTTEENLRVAAKKVLMGENDGISRRCIISFLVLRNERLLKAENCPEVNNRCSRLRGD